jgi:hypothetical protein
MRQTPKLLIFIPQESPHHLIGNRFKINLHPLIQELQPKMHIHIEVLMKCNLLQSNLQTNLKVKNNWKLKLKNSHWEPAKGKSLLEQNFLKG